MIFRAALFLLGLSLAPLHAQTDPITTAKRAGQMLFQAGDALEAAQSSSDRISALSETIRAYEEGLSAMREGLRRVVIRERAIQLTFEAERDRLAQLLGILQTIGNAPAPILMMHPSGPMGAVRSGLIVSDVAPALAAEANALRAQLEELSLLRLLQEDAAKTLETALQEVQTARVALAKAVADRTELPLKFTSDPDQLSALVQNSDTLSSFADNLTRLSTEETLPNLDFDQMKGALELPVSGRALHGFNEADAAGIERPGLVLATPSRALVTAPITSTVRYAGPLLESGNVVILEPGANSLIILEGLAETFPTVGEIVEKGAPLGLMGGNQQSSDAFLINATKGSGGNRQESLYIEVRQGGTPVDPAPWFDLNRE